MKFLLVAIMCLSALAFADNPYAMGCVSGTYTQTISTPEMRTMGVSVTSPQVWLGKAYGGLVTGWQDVPADTDTLPDIRVSTNTGYLGYQFISPEAFSPYVCLEMGITTFDYEQGEEKWDDDNHFYFGQSVGFLQYVGDFSIDGSFGHSQVFEDEDIHSWTLGTEIGYSWWIPEISSSIGLTCIFGEDVDEDEVISISPMTFSF
jgi:hypothetical protein